IVTSRGVSGSSGRGLLSWLMSVSPSSANRPQFHGEIRELAGLMDGDAAGPLEGAPQLMGAIQLEVRKPRVIGNLPWRDGHRLQRDARQLQIHQIADLLDRTDLHLRREPAAQVLGRNVGTRREYERGSVEQGLVGHAADADPELLVSEGNG